MNTIRPATAAQAEAVSIACYHLRLARDLLAQADAPRALERVRLALSSAEGAERHVRHRLHRSENARNWHLSSDRGAWVLSNAEDADLGYAFRTEGDTWCGHPWGRTIAYFTGEGAEQQAKDYVVSIMR